jgi:hypothetical protein
MGLTVLMVRDTVGVMMTPTSVRKDIFVQSYRRAVAGETKAISSDDLFGRIWHRGFMSALEAHCDLVGMTESELKSESDTQRKEQ